MAENGITIPSATEFTLAQLTDLIPVARGAAGGTITPEKIIALALTQGVLTQAQIENLIESYGYQTEPDVEALIQAFDGFLTGDSEAGYFQNSDTGARSQLDQVGLGLGGATPTPNCAQKNLFHGILNSAAEIQAPTNVPTGAGGIDAFYFRMYLSGTGDVTFDSSYIPLSNSKPYHPSNDAREMNIIHCYNIGSYTIYRIENSAQIGQLQTFDVTIPAADILTSNSAPVELVAAPGSGKFISPERIYAALVNGDTPYGTNTTGVVGHVLSSFISVDLSDAFTFFSIPETVAAELALINNSPLLYRTAVGNPENGNYDLRVWGTYRILDI